MLCVIMLGPPGSGKGTQADLISKRYGIPHISSGELLRSNPNLPPEIKRQMDAGEILKDEDVLGLVKERLARPDAQKGWVLDGFPRTANQAELLDKMFEGEKIYVLHLIISDEKIQERLTNRRTCSGCGRIYNLVNSAPQVEGVCDDCGSSLFQRDDDKKEVIAERLKVYRSMTAPLVEHYAKAGELFEIDCSLGQSPDNVDTMITEVLPA